MNVPDTLLQEDRLVWLPELGMGYFPARDAGVYDASYFAKYQAYAETPMGRELTDFRVELVAAHLEPRSSVVDVGIGCGAFLQAMQRTCLDVTAYGFDVCPEAIRWLSDREILVDFWAPMARWDALTFWDVLEHIPNPTLALRRARRWAFVTIPTFQDADHVLRSKHFRKDEHRWYWTRAGFIAWADANGFRCVDHSTRESLLGREDVETFVLRRR